MFVDLSSTGDRLTCEMACKSDKSCNAKLNDDSVAMYIDSSLMLLDIIAAADRIGHQVDWTAGTGDRPPRHMTTTTASW